jgi:hypothetical protein
MKNDYSLIIGRIFLIIFLAWILFMLFTSCSITTKTRHTYSFYSEVTAYIELEFDSEKEAIKTQRRMARKCREPQRTYKTLRLSKCQLEATNMWGVSYIKEKYRDKIEEQLYKW